MAATLRQKLGRENGGASGNEREKHLSELSEVFVSLHSALRCDWRRLAAFNQQGTKVQAHRSEPLGIMSGGEKKRAGFLPKREEDLPRQRGRGAVFWKATRAINKEQRLEIHPCLCRVSKLAACSFVNSVGGRRTPDEWLKYPG